MRRWSRAGGVAVVLSVAMASGCMIAIGDRVSDHKTGDGPRRQVERRVPDQAKLVAFGREMEFVLPANGMVYLVNAASGELLFATHLNKGETFRIHGNMAYYGNRSQSQANWRLAFQDHELYFRPVDWSQEPQTPPAESTGMESL